jgi:hypothetical protein
MFHGGSGLLGTTQLHVKPLGVEVNNWLSVGSEGEVRQLVIGEARTVTGREPDDRGGPRGARGQLLALSDRFVRVLALVVVRDFVGVATTDTTGLAHRCRDSPE